MSAITPFIFEDNLVRVHMIDGDPWWVLADLCRVLGIANPRDAASRLDDDERSTVASTDGAGGPDRNIVNESGMYALVFTSRKEVARRFRKWVTAEVLPAIRKTGRYQVPEVEPILPEEAISTLHAKLAMLKECRMIFGPARARALWSQLGLPVSPVEPVVDAAQSKGMGALTHLLASTVFGKSTWADYIRDAEADLDTEVRMNLAGDGIRPGDEMFWIANNGRALSRAFASTEWAGNWKAAWRGIPGATPAKSIHRVDGKPTAGWLIPRAAIMAPLASSD